MAIQVVTGDGSRVPAILLANKCDLREESTVMIMILRRLSSLVIIMITMAIFMIILMMITL